MTTNTEIEGRRDKSVARAIAYSSTFIAEKAENAMLAVCNADADANAGAKNAMLLSRT